MKNIRAKGKRYEYRALEVLKERGYKAIRIPASATGKQPLPDIIAVKDGTIYAVEVKSSSSDCVKVRGFQLEKLKQFCDMFSFCNCKTSVLAFFTKYKTVKHYLINDVDGREDLKICLKGKD